MYWFLFKKKKQSIVSYWDIKVLDDKYNILYDNDVSIHYSYHPHILHNI